MIIDSHCHLDFKELNSRLDEIIKDSHKVGIRYLLTICTNNESFNKINQIINKYINVYGTYGIHPHETKNYADLLSEDIQNKMLKNKKLIGIGESGLDFYYNHSDSKVQKKCFIEHIHASQQTSKTLIVHSRNAENETLDILSSEMKNKEFKVLMHCFTGTKEFADKLLNIGCYFSASGIVTFKKNYELSETFKSIPDDKILVETDSPYLSPEPLRGKINEPKNLIYTVRHLSKIKGVSEESVSKFTSNNFFKLFNIRNG